MLQQTVSLWRRMVGSSVEPALKCETSSCDERRLWMRYATNLVGKLHMPDRRAGDKVLAQIRDLSAAGANLVIDRPLQTGQMVTLELQADIGEIHSVLACVVHVNEERAGSWSLGCIFSRELSNEDLGAFGALKIPTDLGDPRTWVRFPINVKASCRKVGDAGDTSNPGEVLNISASGIGLLMPVAVEAGTLLNVDLLDANGHALRTILACVVHTTERNGGDHAVGCNFIRELTEEELQTLLQ
jgi:PilZ domain-containing protein